jgi:hypothetical protein
MIRILSRHLGIPPEALLRETPRPVDRTESAERPATHV